MVNDKLLTVIDRWLTVNDKWLIVWIKKRLLQGFETAAFFIVENPLRSFTFAVEKEIGGPLSIKTIFRHFF